MKTMIDRVFAWGLAQAACAGMFLGVVGFSSVQGCSAAQLSSVQDASGKRDTICAFVDAWSQNRPELAEVQQLCQAGADLKAIAAAYAGCSEAPDNG